jgi:hypothetical protein
MSKPDIGFPPRAHRAPGPVAALVAASPCHFNGVCVSNLSVCDGQSQAVRITTNRIEIAYGCRSAARNTPHLSLVVLVFTSTLIVL